MIYNEKMTRHENKERKYTAPALEKGLDILELLAARGVPLTMSQMATELGRSVGEVFRMIEALIRRGYIAPADEGEGLELTNKLFALALARPPARNLLENALPEMRRLTRTIGQSCHLAVASDEQMVVIARIEAPGNEGYSVRVGNRRPLVASTSGLVLYAFQPPGVRTQLRKRLAATVSSKMWKAFEERAASARIKKHVRADSDVTRHIVDLSAPVMATDTVVAALTCPFIETPKALSIKETICAIRQAADEISARLTRPAAV